MSIEEVLTKEEIDELDRELEAEKKRIVGFKGVLHIYHSTVKCGDPALARTNCGRILPHNEEKDCFVIDWDNATCKNCIRVQEAEEREYSGWIHPSHREER